ncbi:MAG: chemotaxis protein CheA [Alphaproteobacteria bacterium]|nr:chemotaxis protein CheA [Alphaproteobacteria bacterium]
MSSDLTEAYAQFKATFFQECRELFADLEHQLSLLEAGDQDPEILHAIFRAIHSIKAGAATFGFADLVRVSHNFEALLDRLRNGHMSVSDDLVGTLFRGADLVQDLVECAEEGREASPDATTSVEKEIESWMGSASVQATEKAASAVGSVGATGRNVRYRIEFEPKASMFRNANEPLLLFRELGELGRLEVLGDVSRLPRFDDLEPESAYLSWVLYLETIEAPDRIEEVFEFVEDECKLAISVTDVAREQDQDFDGFGLFGDDDDGFGLFGDDDGISTNPQPSGDTETAVNAPEPVAAPTSTQVASASPTKAPDEQTAPAAAPTSSKGGSIRVELDRIDKLVDMVGEIVITQSMLSQEMQANEALRNSRIGTGMTELSNHIRELQDNVMAVRMQPVKSVFARMPRIVRDVAGKLGKKVKLVTQGEGTEVDKTVIEELADPLTHMIRNSLDHGLETPEERTEAGKPEEGTITLSAEHRGGRIVIQIIDDGRGINRPKVLSLAKEKGVVSEDATLSDEEIDNLIFAPGFSTADEVTDLSGRGVGMDVVRRNIQSLGGRVSVSSEPGVGTRFLLTLPLTLAVLDGMVVGVGNQRYVVPIGSIIETVRPQPKDVNEMVGGGHVVNIRGNYVRLIPLARIFGIEGAETDPSKGLVVLVEADGGRVIGLVLDMLAGQQQVVIKSLESNFCAVEGVASATILGDGSVCLILDIDALADMEGVNYGKLSDEPLAVPAE